MQVVRIHPMLRQDREFEFKFKNKNKNLNMNMNMNLNLNLRTATNGSSLRPPRCGVSPRDRWSCVLPRWQLNVNVNRDESKQAN
jgi:hypothetical protein